MSVGDAMADERLKVFVPFLLVDGVLVFAFLMLVQLDWFVHHTLYSYGLSFDLAWAEPYWSFVRIILGLLVFAVVVVTVVGYASYKKARREGGKVVFLCKSCGNAWSEIDRGVKVRNKLPKFKILKSCPSCNRKLLDEANKPVKNDLVEDLARPQMLAKA